MQSYGTDERGASAAEYALLLAIVGATIAASLFFLGDAVGNSVNNSATVLAGSTNSVSDTDNHAGGNGKGKAIGRGGGNAGGNGNGNAGGNGQGKGGKNG